MKLQRTPLILLLLALALGSVVTAMEFSRSAKQPQAGQTPTEPLFGFKESDVKVLRLTTPNQTLLFEKAPATAAVSPKEAARSLPSITSTEWQMRQPEKTQANDAHVAFLLNLLATGSRLKTLQAAPDKAAEFGLDKPSAIAEVTLANQTTHRLRLGKPNFDRSGIYAQIDPPAQPGAMLSVVLVPIDFENATNRPLAEWKAIDSKTAPKPQVVKPSPSPKPSPEPSR